jgi:CRISPR/Cas system CMR-associated protein Cmr5 small subunit
MTVISEMSQSEYLHMQEETLALLEWVKRYANADLLSKR